MSTHLPSPIADPVINQFLARCADAIANGALGRLLLSSPLPDEDQLERITIRLIELRGETQLNFQYRHRTRDLTRNFTISEGMGELRTLLTTRFRNAQLSTPQDEAQLAISRKGRASVRIGKALSTAAPQSPAHNRQKHRLIDVQRPFLSALGVTDARHQVIPAMSRKWKQINKFIEILAAALDSAGLAAQRDLHVVDFGSGKGYLTFAVHDWLRGQPDSSAEVTGIELRPDLVEACNTVIDTLGLQGLRIEQGDVRSWQPARLDVMIALHACDIATDHAIHLGIRAGARVILCSPCCHKELRPQMKSPALLAPLLQHGVHLGQEAEMLTDGLRALLLDALGYQTQVFEFVSLEHTSKNKMILAVKRPDARPAPEVLAQISALKAFYGVHEQRLESLLQADGQLARA